MLAVILKNTILVVLIICIGFFLIDNHLQELSNELKIKVAQKHESEQNANKGNSKSSPVKDIIESSKVAVSTEERTGEHELEEELLPSADDNNISRAMKIRIDDNMKEIYDYVFGDSEAPDDLKNMYVAPDVPDKGEVCSTETSEKNRYENMCKDPIQEHHDKVNYQYISMEPASNKSLLNIVEDSKLEITA